MYAIVKSPRDPIFTETAFAPRESADDYGECEFSLYWWDTYKPGKDRLETSSWGHGWDSDHNFYSWVI